MMFCFCLYGNASAQQKFPAWMDEVEPEGANSKETQGFNEPMAPVDPSTGQQSGLNRPAGSVLGKPRLPDFSKMREKALKAELERRASATGELKESYNASLTNLDQLKKSRNQLETLLSANPGENGRHQLLKGLGDLDQKIALSEEFLKLLGGPSAQAGVAPAVASLTSSQFDRVKQIQQLLFPQLKSTVSSPVQPAAAEKASPAPFAARTEQSEEAEPTEEELRRARTYRPGRIKSFFIESKKAQQQNEEATQE